MRTHELKIHPKYYKEILVGFKKTELRLNDRALLVKTGQLRRKISQVYKDLPGLKENYVLLQIEKI